MAGTVVRPLPELLAPAGNYRALVAAVAAGADAVYVGLGRLNARVSAGGFDALTLAHGCALAHEHGVRVYAALNVYVLDEEFEEAFALVEEALACGADAFIVADLGLIAALGERFPGIEAHVSTQTGVHAPEAVDFLGRELQVGRVTVGRELSLPEIAELCCAGVPIEVFVHGAICIAYSGACSFSAVSRGRSAMRGDCTQPCRMAYDLVDEGGQSVVGVEGDKLLCPRDYLGIAHLEELWRAGVSALKIEGRMKNPDYVFNVVGAYRQALDALAQGESYDAEALTRRLAQSFNRGYTDAYLVGAPADAELMSFERSINQGALVGKVVALGRSEIEVGLSAAVGKGDTLEVRFYPGEHTAKDAPKRWPQLTCPADAAAGERLWVHCKRRIEAGAEVYLTRSQRLLNRTEEAMRGLDPALGPQGKRPKKGAGSGAKERVMESKGASVLQGIDEDVLLSEVLRPNNRAETLAQIARAKEAGKTLVCRNLAQVELCRQAGARFCTAHPIFCANSRTEALLRAWGAEEALPPDELSLKLGGTELMVMEHCVLTAEGPCAGACETCGRRAAGRYVVDQMGNKYQVRVDAHGRSRIFASV